MNLHSYRDLLYPGIRMKAADAGVNIDCRVPLLGGEIQIKIGNDNWRRLFSLAEIKDNSFKAEFLPRMHRMIGEYKAR